jgi:hypothetical protein
MLFARFKGGEGNFTKSKTYIVTQTGTDTVNLHRAMLRDDKGERVTFNPDDDHRFEFCEEVFAVLLMPIWADSYPGLIVRLDDVTSDGAMVRCQDVDETPRFIDAHVVIILDPSNISLGFEVMDVETGVWQRIERIDEALWVKTEFSGFLRPMTDYTLSVSDGEIDRVRIAKCINAAGADSLTEGYQYRVFSESDSEVTVNTDEDCMESFDNDRFNFL